MEEVVGEEVVVEVVEVEEMPTVRWWPHAVLHCSIYYIQHRYR